MPQWLAKTSLELNVIVDCGQINIMAMWEGVNIDSTVW